MVMGAPVITSDQTKFFFSKTLVYNKPVDDNNVPFDPDATVTETQPAPVSAPCGIEYFDADDQPIVFGSITATKLRVTLLDEDYDRVKGCAWLVVGGERYFYKRTRPPQGLFDVGVYTLTFSAENEM